VVLGGVTGVVLIVIVLCAQMVFGVDLLNTKSNATSVPEATNATSIPGVTSTPQAVPTTGGGGQTPAGSLVAIPGGYDGGWFQLYFTTPINTNDESRFTGSPLEAAVVALLDSATQTIDGAFFQLNSQPITDALIRAKQRNVKVRVVTDGEYGQEAPDSTVDQLELAKIDVKSDGSRGAYMHDKFFVVDGAYVWTGSTNFTHNDIYNNNNNSMLIRSSRLAADYTAAFEVLYAAKFSQNPVPPNPTVTVEGTQIEVFYSPGSGAPARLAELLSSAKSVQFMAYSFTQGLTWKDSSGKSNSIMDLLLQRQQSGQLDLMGIIENTNRRFAKPLVCGGAQVRWDGNPDVLHHKVFIIDGSTVVMGSFNYSQNAQNDNNENMLIIHNASLAQAYLEEFQRLWAETSQTSASDVGC
jgi:phosphatidylserine/phosphatidylglycerophosphate/cardiolipin synthase-like enzyme